MNKRYVGWLYKELPGLVQKGIIAEQNAVQIRQYYGEVSDAAKKQLFIVISSVIGALLIGLGIISLIAHNWESLSRATRACLSILPLAASIGFTGWVLIKEKISDGMREAAATFQTLMVGAAIALISQTYNISGDLSNFVLVWMLLSVPVVYLATATVPAVIYTIGITVWSMTFIWSETIRGMWYWPLLAVVIPHFIAIVRQEKFTVRAMLLAEFLGLSVVLVCAVMLIRMAPAFWVVYYPVIFSVLYLAGTQKFGVIPTAWQQPLFKLGNLGIIVLSLLLTYAWPWGSQEFWGWPSEASATYLAVGSMILTLWFVGSVLLNYRAFKERRLFHLLAGAMPLLAIIGFALKPAAQVIFNIYFLILSITRIREGLRINRLSMVNEGLLMLTVLIAVRFFSSEFSFVIKGLVLILLGVGFLVANIAFTRRKEVQNV